LIDSADLSGRSWLRKLKAILRLTAIPDTLN
jgi:hypothetical protein